MILKYMKAICVLLIIEIFIIIVIGFDIYKNILNVEPDVIDLLDLKFKSYLKDFNKRYEGEEYYRRFENFKASLKEISRLNKLEGNAVFGLTKFADLSKEEFAERYLLKPKYTSPCIPRYRHCLNGDRIHHVELWLEDEEIPTGFDWRNEKFVVGPILNQKLCAGCWAFSIIGVMESMAAIRGIDYKSRSIQELIDCSTYTDHCEGGNVGRALDFLCNARTKINITTADDYPLTLKDNSNCLARAHPSGRLLKEFSYECKMDEAKMVLKIVNHGPLIALVDASSWMYYIGGIIRRACPLTHLNHVVQIVGYNDFNRFGKIPYYIIKNSYGEDFGDQGYVKIAINEGVCGIGEQVSYIEVA